MACSRRRRPSRGTKLGRISRSGGVWQQLQHYAQFPDFNNYLVFLLARAEEKDKLVPFLEREDAAAAKDNMDGAEFLGRVLTVNYAVPKRIKGGEQGWAAQPRVDRCEIFPQLSWESTYKLCYPSSVHCSS